MLFKDIKQNYPVYILDKQDLSIIQGRVKQVSFPHMEVNQETGRTENKIDVTIEANGKTATYVMSEDVSVTYANNLVLATDKMGLANEIEAMKNTAEQALASIEQHKKVLDKSSSLLAELNPVYREKQVTEQRFTKIEDTMSRMEKLMEKQQEIIEGFVKKFES